MMTTIGEFFDVKYGQKEYESKGNLDNGETILISSSGEDNGCYGFFDIKPFYKSPFITVPRTGSIGQAFVQTHDCCANSDVLILIPKNKTNIEVLYQVAYQIRKNKWKYTYGRKITPQRLSQQQIKIVEANIDYQEFTKKIRPKEINKEDVIEKKKIKLVKLTDLCTIHKKAGLHINAINLDGKIPYVSSSSKDNGIVAFTDEDPNFKAKSLTIAKDGNDGISFFQPFDFLTSHHNYVLIPKGNYPKFLLFYIGAVVRKRAYCYNHYYPLSRKHLERMEIPMPINENGEYDFEYIEKLIKNCYGFQELNNICKLNEK